jgi:hypothetical protein
MNGSPSMEDFSDFTGQGDIPEGLGRPLGL